MKNLDQFLTLSLDQFLTLKPPNLGPVSNFTAYIYIYIYMLWSYYLVQVWVFWKLLSGPSLFFLQHRLPKNTIKIEDSAHIFGKKIRAQNFGSYYLVQVGVF